MNRTKIEWADWTWNPIVGCSPISSGCEHCYAAAISRRFGLPWGSARFHEDRLEEPLHVKKPGRIFVGSMTDLWHPSVHIDWLYAVYAAMAQAPWHTYIMLTKRPHLIGELPRSSTFWLGVTAETQEDFDERWERLMWDEDADVRFVSVEPMLEPMTLRPERHPLPDWVIAGPETGPGAQPCKDEWIEALSDESFCFFDKRKMGWTRREFPDA